LPEVVTADQPGEGLQPHVRWRLEGADDEYTTKHAEDGGRLITYAQLSGPQRQDSSSLF
jgi:hypothetical protein